MKTIEEILNDPPPDVDLTLVGGQALIYWTLSYQESFPQLFPDEVISSTFDIDFVVRFKIACHQCAEHWKGKLILPGQDDHTPELGKILIEGDDGEDALQIDLLPDL